MPSFSSEVYWHFHPYYGALPYLSLLLRKLDSHLMIVNGILASESMFLRPSCQTVSKAFSASMNMATVLPVGLLLDHRVTCSDNLMRWWTHDFDFLKPH